MKENFARAMFVLVLLTCQAAIGQDDLREKSLPADSMFYQPATWQGQDIWFSNSYYRSGLDNNQLVVGGWGDSASSLIKFDLMGLPKRADRAYLWLYAYPNSDTSTKMNGYIVASSWSERSNNYFGISVYTPPTLLTAPTPGSWYQLDITSVYNAWQSRSIANQGLLFAPAVPNNPNRQFTGFYSSDYSSAALRPKLVVNYTPTVAAPAFKLPLPGGKSWMVTTEIGGTDCATTWVDPNHQGMNYYAIDIAPVTTGGVAQSNVKVLAAASGYVRVVASNQYNGNYVIIDHDGDNNENTGFITYYLHLKDLPTLRVGQWVNQGDTLGIMGNTGQSTGTHVHFEVKYNQLAGDELAFVKVDGLPMKSYQTECAGATRTKYYPSTNRQ